jgi:hypothetical protein
MGARALRGLPRTNTIGISDAAGFVTFLTGSRLEGAAKGLVGDFAGDLMSALDITSLRAETFALVAGRRPFGRCPSISALAALIGLRRFCTPHLFTDRIG